MKRTPLRWIRLLLVLGVCAGLLAAVVHSAWVRGLVLHQLTSRLSAGSGFVYTATALDYNLLRLTASVDGLQSDRGRPRIALTTAFAVPCGVILVIGWSLRKEKAARLVGEANRLLALGRNELEADPAAALAYAVASLELSDNSTGRMFAMEALSRSPAALLAPVPISAGQFIACNLDFSPDGNWLAVGGLGGVRVIPRDGSATIVVSDKVSGTVGVQKPQFAPDSDRLVFTSNDEPSIVRVWSMWKGKEVQAFQLEGPTR